jgi:hypothetical protein
MQVRQIQDLSKAQEIKIAPIGDLKFLKISGKFWEEVQFYCFWTSTDYKTRNFKKPVALGFCNLNCPIDSHYRHWKYFTYVEGDVPTIKGYPGLRMLKYVEDNQLYFYNGRKGKIQRGNLNKTLLIEKAKRQYDIFVTTLSKILDSKTPDELRRIIEDINTKYVVKMFKQTNDAQSDDSDKRNHKLYVSYIDDLALI